MLIHTTGHARRVRVAGLLLAASAGLWPALGQDGKATKPPRDDPAARKLLDQVTRAYQTLSSYSDQGQFEIAMTLAGKAQRQVRPLRLTLVRPNKLDLDAGAVRLTCDGKTLTTVVEPLKKYMTAAAPAAISFDTFREGPAGAVLFGGPMAAPLAVLLHLVTGVNPAIAIDQMGVSIQSTPGRGPGPQAPGLLIDMVDGPDLELRLDPATRLLSAIELLIDPKQLAAGAPPGQVLSIQRFGWSAGVVTTKVAPDRSFAFKAPAGFSQVESLKDQPGAAPAPQHAIEEKLGKPAPEYVLTLLDGAGKTKTLTRADLAGKVVLIDFWATWCGPCLMELPEIQKLIEHYADSKKDVMIVALSQDSQPDELAEVRKLVEKTLSDKRIMLSRNPVGWIGLDPSGSVGKVFEVEGYPTLVITDGKGIVQSAHVGYNPDAAEPLSKLLAREIDTLLEGKSLVAPKESARKP
jgi:thiol-disulfide isomerase/thioredoxin